MKWSETRVLVTGAGGFIGGHLCERLVRLGSRVRGFLRYTSHGFRGCLEFLPPEIHDEIEIFYGDIRSPERVFEALSGVDVVFHLASLIAIPYSYADPREYAETNVMGALNLLSAARSLETRKLIFTSTSEVFGTAQYVPIDERHPLQAQSPYAASKIAADKFAQSFHCAFNLPVVILRPFNTYGPRQSTRAVIPTIITQALSGQRLRLGSLHPTRDFTFVRDTVEGFILAAEKGGAGEEFNIGSGKEISIEQLTRLISELVGANLDVVREDERVRPPKSEVEQLLAGVEKARKHLGWEPRVNLREGLQETIEWFRKHANRYKAEIYSI